MNEIIPSLPPFTEVEGRICHLCGLLPDLPKQEVILSRLYLHIAKALRDVSNQVLKPFDLNYVSFSTLMMLFGTSDTAVNPSQLCDVTRETRTNMTRIVDDLVARGFIKRRASAKDRRRVALSLTARGEALVKKILPRLWEKQTRIYECFGHEEKKVLEGLLKRQLASIGAVR